MTGCPAAIEAAQRYQEAAESCPELANGLHQRGGRCRRIGGPRQCADCSRDLMPQEEARRTQESVASERSGVERYPKAEIS